MKTYKVDLDYESFLFNPQYAENSASSEKIIREFEYVFFLINKESCRLKNIRPYDLKYLDELKKLGFVIPELASQSKDSKEAEYWWGLRKNVELERMLNSKLTSATLSAEHSWGFFQGAIVNRAEEVFSHLKNHPQVKEWIIKRPHGFSGIGHYYFAAEKIDVKVLEKILVEKVLLEPAYKRIFDIGTTFIIEEGVIKRQFMVENFNSGTGGFKGGAGASNVNKFKKYIENKYAYSLDELEKTTQKIAEKYLELGAICNIQIDSFIYLIEGEKKLYPLVEVNYRKTMGLVIQALADKHPESGHVEWKVLDHKEELQEKLNEDLQSWKKISPEGNHFRSFYKSFERN